MQKIIAHDTTLPACALQVELIPAAAWYLDVRARGEMLRAAHVYADSSGRPAEMPIQVCSRVCPSHEPDLRYLGTSGTLARVVPVRFVQLLPI